MEIPERWAKAIRSAGFGSLSALANEARMSTNQVVAVVSGAAPPDRDSLRSLAAPLGLSIEELEGLIETAQQQPDPYVPPAGSERLTPRQREVVTEVILAFLESNRAMGELD